MSLWNFISPTRITVCNQFINQFINHLLLNLQHTKSKNAVAFANAQVRSSTLEAELETTAIGGRGGM
jgi:hypothetical protein